MPFAERSKSADPLAAAAPPARSAIARLQRLSITGLLASSALWALGWWHIGWPTVGVLGALAILGLHAWVLGVEVLISRAVNRRSAGHVPGWRASWRAWVAESLLYPQVFYGRQPWCWRAHADRLPVATGVERTPGRGVVLVHGFMCNRGFWNPWMRRLQASGVPFLAVNLEPPLTSIDDHLPTVDAAVRRMAQATGQPVVVVGHSMGGLVARAWRAGPGRGAPVARIVTIGSPHHGTWMAAHSRAACGVQMRCGSDWMSALVRGECDGDTADAPAAVPTLAPAGGAPGVSRRPGAYADFICFYSDCDNIVFPTETGCLPGADNRLLAGLAHVELAFAPDVLRCVMEAAAAATPEPAIQAGRAFASGSGK